MIEYMNDASSEREAYSTPNYERFTFETSGLVQTSEEPVAGAIGDGSKDFSTAIPMTSMNSDW